MARRHFNPSREKFNEAELEQHRGELVKMSKWELEIHYKATHNACRLTTHIPSPRLMQELVQAWKELRKR